ncbi:MAG TPA: hypothetical protein VK501_05310 [Baekduia sp.]|uniref:hypothetical protein n=1 Tax=Baekduia sp. TaxID=2600305 RepID=UPI002BE7621F|nr:hypothetical protein [Baekduia sp.]HMJ33316.1 hypothetical protein [Baekduia sp.]
MRRRLVLLITALALSAVPATPAWGARVFGPGDGVQATLTAGRTLELRFTGASAAGVKAGQVLRVSCSAHPDPAGLLFVGSGDDVTPSGSGKVATGGVLRVQLDRVAPVDECDVWRLDGEELWPPIVARAALDPAGASWVDEVVRALPLSDLLGRARSSKAYVPAASVVGGNVVALGGQTASVPSGQLGYWTDGAAHAVAATTSAAGRRLVVEDLGAGMLRTNVLEQAGVLDGLLFGLGASEITGTASEAHPSPYKGKEALGAHDGVRAAFAGRRLTIRFTRRSAAVFRALVGRRVEVSCVRRPAPGLFGGTLAPPVVHAARARVPRRGGTLTVSLGGTGDLCAVGDAGTLVALFAATAAGHWWSADVAAINVLDQLPDSLAAPGGTAYLTPAAIVAKHPRLLAMSSQGAAVPAGRVGVWTDGAQHALVAVTSPSGRRFVLADEGEGVLRTNVYAELLGLAYLGTG